MLISNVNNNQPVFSSRFIVTKHFKQTFDRAIEENDREFLKVLKSIVNDRKRRNIKIDVNYDGKKYDRTLLSISNRSDGYWAGSDSEKGKNTKDKIISDIKTVLDNFSKKEMLIKDNTIDTLHLEEVRTRLIKLKDYISKQKPFSFRH